MQKYTLQFLLDLCRTTIVRFTQVSRSNLQVKQAMALYSALSVSKPMMYRASMNYGEHSMNK